MDQMSNDCMSMNNIRMLYVSIIAGVFVTMNTWVYRFSDIKLLHVNDIYMIVLMAVLMIFISMIFMNAHNIDTKTYIVYVLIILVIFFLIRNQIFVDDVQYMRGMIPHHSMAILMSQKIKEKTKNPKIIQLADQIIESQEKEIDIMNHLLKEY